MKSVKVISVTDKRAHNPSGKISTVEEKVEVTMTESQRSKIDGRFNPMKGENLNARVMIHIQEKV